MRILVACEESQAVTIELRRLGHEAFSCDVLLHSGSNDEWHIQQDVLPLLNGNCTFKTVDGSIHTISGKWGMIIAFPPCTHLCSSGAAWFEEKKKDGRQQQGIDFFMKFVNADCEKIAIENPIGIMSTHYRKPDQKIQPWQFGDAFQKTTCIWLKGLPLLQPTNIVDKGEFITHKSGKVKPKWFADAFKLPPEERTRARSKTFPGIAKAMAEQWGKG